MKEQTKQPGLPTDPADRGKVLELADQTVSTKIPLHRSLIDIAMHTLELSAVNAPGKTHNSKRLQFLIEALGSTFERFPLMSGFEIVGYGSFALSLAGYDQSGTVRPLIEIAFFDAEMPITGRDIHEFGEALGNLWLTGRDSHVSEMDVRPMLLRRDVDIPSVLHSDDMTDEELQDLAQRQARAYATAGAKGVIEWRRQPKSQNDATSDTEEGTGG